MKYVLALLFVLSLSSCDRGSFFWWEDETTTLTDVEKPRPKPESIEDWKKEVQRLSGELDQAKRGLAAAREDAIQTKLAWLIGVMVLTAVGSAALAVFVPSMASMAIKIGLAATAVAAIAAVASWLLPYLLWIGLALVVVAVIAAVLYWRLDAKSRDQVVRAVDDLKDKIPGYKDHFNQYIDEDADAHLDRVRERLGLKARSR